MTPRNVSSQAVAGIHSRDSSVSGPRGRPLDTSGRGLTTLQPQSRSRGQSQSKSPESNAGRSDSVIERKPSLSSYGHHRKTSIVHGIQHSRSPSYTPTSAGPLSPEIIASAGTGSMAGISLGSEHIFANRAEDSEPILKFPANGNNGPAPPASGLSTIQDDDEHLTLGQTVTRSSSSVHKKIPSNSKLRREHSHSRAHSKNHQEAKTVGEYALHHLFNSVSPKLLTIPLSLLMRSLAIVRRLRGQQNQPKHRQSRRSRDAGRRGLRGRCRSCFRPAHFCSGTHRAQQTETSN